MVDPSRRSLRRVWANLRERATYLFQDLQATFRSPTLQTLGERSLTMFSVRLGRPHGEPSASSPPARTSTPPLLTPRVPHLPWMLPEAHLPPTVGTAADQPPNDWAVLQQQLAWFDALHGADPLRIPLGWRVRAHGGLWLETATFQPGQPNSIVNLLTTGQIGSGKDVLVRTILLTLLERNHPDDLQLVILDGKGLDYPAYAALPHVVGLANQIAEIPPLLAWLDQERERRKQLILGARDRQGTAHAKSWHEAADPKPCPLLVVYISELTTLDRYVDQFWNWLNDHLSQDRALGICYLVGTQTASNTQTRWRVQVQLFMAGYQPSLHDDRPNTNVTSFPEGVVPPSGLPTGGGYFTAVLGRKVGNVRASFIRNDQEQQILEAIMQRWGRAATAATPPGTTAGTASLEADNPHVARVLAPVSRTGSLPDHDVPPDTNAVRAGSPLEAAPAVVRPRPNQAELVTWLTEEPIEHATVARLLARVRRSDGSYWFSANKIAESVGGTRSQVLSLVRAEREGDEASV
nr:FtsK/SpoIIIE domain-containing protein [Candidatus Chloroploca mongolica]